MFRKTFCILLIALSRSIFSFCWISSTSHDRACAFQCFLPSIVHHKRHQRSIPCLPITIRSSCRLAAGATTNRADVETIQQSFLQLPSGSDIRGQFVDLPYRSPVGEDVDHVWMIQSTLEALKNRSSKGSSSLAPLTPLSAYCIGYAFASYITSSSSSTPPTICIGRDPRPHGELLKEYFTKGAVSFGATVKDTGIATTPSMFEFCRAGKCDGGVMVTASHLPIDRNGFKLFSKVGGFFRKKDIQALVENAAQVLQKMDQNQLEIRLGVLDKVDFMPHYATTLRDSIVREVQLGLDETERSDIPLPLAGLRIVLNSGHGSGGFFYHVLHDLGADISQSQHLNRPDATFPSGIPNPESDHMVKETTKLCEEIDADIGIMLDTDADRCGFIVPTASSTSPFRPHQYQPLNRNRLIALLGRIFSERSPGCAIVTDSVTSEGLAKFLSNLGVKHVRYLKGYANVIEKAMELSQSGQANAEVAIETSGHCAMKENGYLDDGTYTAVKVIACLAQVAARDRSNRSDTERSRNNESSSDGGSSNPPSNLLDLISALEELEEVRELRLSVKDGSLATTEAIFQEICHQVDNACHGGEHGWELDVDNLEGIRVRTPGSHGGFFMVRKSLHDPLLSLQVEGRSRDEVRAQVIQPTLQLLSNSRMCIADILDLTVLNNY